MNNENINLAATYNHVWAPAHMWLNGMNESFNGKFRDECLNMQWFKNRFDAKVLIESFRREYNEIRPHSSLGQLTPLEFKCKLSQSALNPELLPEGPRGPPVRLPCGEDI